MTRQELLDALFVERFAGSVRSDRPGAVEPSLEAVIAELDAAPAPLRVVLDEPCQYAACKHQAIGYLDGWALCATHRAKHRSEVAS